MATKQKLPSTAVGRRRLLKLAGMLEADAKNKRGIQFDLSIWGVVESADKPLSCGTTACAMGLAALSGAFKRQGLGYRVDRGSLDITWNGRANAMIAARRLFDITEDQADFLFVWTGSLPTWHGAAGERAVAKRIRDFVAGSAAP